MTAIWAMLAQAIMISIAYPFACLAAAAFATIAILNLGPVPLAESWEGAVQLGAVILSTTITALVGAFWPSAVAVAITEGLKLRSMVVYLVLGLLVGLVMALPLGAMIDGAPMPPVDADEVQLGLAAGAIGGFVYWAIAGRSAGRWLELRWFEPNRY